MTEVTHVDLRRSVSRDVTLGWAESPLQLLSIIEAHHSGILGDKTVLIPRQGVQWLGPTADEVQSLGLPPGLSISRPQSRFPRHDGVLVIGDSFSGVVQAHLATRVRSHLVLVDDGLATLEMLNLLASRRAPLTRSRGKAGQVGRMGRWALGGFAATMLRSAAKNGRLDIMTSMAVDPALYGRLSALGVRLHSHDFPWLRSRPSGDVPSESTIVLGSSLCHDGLIKHDAYIEWILSNTQFGKIAYFPHRREEPAILEELGHHADVRIVTPGVPVELSLRGLRSGQRVSSLPSTAVLSLRTLLGPTGVEVTVTDVSTNWWTPEAGKRIRSRLSTLG